MKATAISILTSVFALGPIFAFAQAPATTTTTTAAENPVFAVRAGASVDWDSNVFQLSDSVDPVTVLGTSTKSDTVTSAFVGIHFDKTYSLQRFYLDASATAIRHANFSYLDFNPLEYQGGWDWRVGPRLSGTVSADRKQALINYGDFRNTSVRNTVTIEHRKASLDGWVSGGWHALLAATQDVSKNSVPFVQVASYRSDGADAGVRYLSPTGNSVELHAAAARGKTLDQPLDPLLLIDDGFRRTEHYVLAKLPLSVKSTLSGRLGRMEYRSNNFSQRSFSGNTGNLGYEWHPTGKLALLMTAARDLTPYVADTSSYMVTDTYTFAPSWQLSPKTAFNMTLSRASADFRGPVVVSLAPLCHDDVSSVQLGLSWKPLRSVTVDASLRHQRRSTNATGYDFEESGASVSASVLF